MGYGVNKYHFFKCDRFKTDCHSTINFKFTSKADRSAINIQEIVDHKLKGLNDTKRSTRSNGTASSFQHMVEAEIVRDAFLSAENGKYVVAIQYGGTQKLVN